jgi:hypothetical protein
MTQEELEAEFVRLTAAGEFDKIQRTLRSRREQVPREVVKEIVQEACLEVVKRQRDGGKITNVAGLVWFPPRAVRQAAERIPGCQYTELPGLGHGAPLLAADQVNPILAEFLD